MNISIEKQTLKVILGIAVSMIFVAGSLLYQNQKSNKTEEVPIEMSETEKKRIDLEKKMEEIINATPQKEPYSTIKQPLKLSPIDSLVLQATIPTLSFISPIISEYFNEPRNILFQSPTYNAPTNTFYFVAPAKDITETDRVIAYNFDTQEKKVLYSKDVLDYPYDVNQSSSRIDIEISPSGKKLAISTRDSLFIYHTDSGELETIFYKPQPQKSIISNVNDVYGYRLGEFSPDESHIIVYERYYEGSAIYIVSLDTKQDLVLAPKGEYYSAGLGWIGNSLIVSKNNTTEDYLETSRDTILSKVDITTNSATDFITYNRTGAYAASGLVEGSMVYTMRNDRNDVASLIRVDTETGETKTLITIGSTLRSTDPQLLPFTDNRAHMITGYAFVPIADKKQLVVQLTTSDYTNKVSHYFIVDENNENTLTPLVLTLEENE